MKKVLMIFLVLAVTALFIGIVSHYATAQKKSSCTRITDRVLTYLPGRYLVGELVMPGFDIFGYNYQAHLFNGYYANAYLNGDGFPPYEGNDEAYFERLIEEARPGKTKAVVEAKWYWPYRNDVLSMKWNDAWLSNMDCDSDGALDRYHGFDSYIGSGAWETNHQSGTYMLDGKECHWTYFVKIVAVPADASFVDTNGNNSPDDYVEFWYTPDGKEIGPSIWGEFAIIEEVWNDPCAGIHGVQYRSPAGPGFGKW
jgi:hypothetical protein